MDFELSEKHQMLQRATREFAENVVAPRVPEMEETHELPRDLVAEMAGMGLMGILTPAEYGGTDMGFLARVVAVEQISRVSAAAGMFIQTHHTGMAAILDFGTPEQKRKYLPSLSSGATVAALAITEPSGGSDVMGMQAAARRDGDGYVLNGRKCFISNSHQAGTIVVVARTGEGPKGLSAFIVESGAPGFRPGRKEQKCGLLGVTTGELIMQECRVPRENLIGEEGAGMRVALKAISETGRLGMAATALGIIGACLEKSVHYARSRKLYGRYLLGPRGGASPHLPRRVVEGQRQTQRRGGHAGKSLCLRGGRPGRAQRHHHPRRIRRHERVRCPALSAGRAGLCSRGRHH